MDIRNIAGLWCDDITFCPKECDWTDCPRNSKNIRDKTIPHSYSVEIPKDCLKKLAERLIPIYEQETGRKTKTGHWIEKEDYNLDTYYDCSVCGESWMPIDGTPWQNGMNYCPNCGAKMEKENGEVDTER